MRFLKNLFQKLASEASENKPGNTQLFALIEQYFALNRSQVNEISIFLIF